ncbi:malate synthase [Agromyces flavus]|uniref:Malate synthase n=1 Tax=Agromyces flavus TaxID=589382 RepID=A0A1H1VGN0_9MICO|nr:malate synthase A [Agromyces flavus]MCP2365916.1 malate synthase [Agromyces flavus]GGI43637.1 malate synthase [Agromyces flavus]SDS83269.1 malate synthase [Agromyces flavus]
MTIEIARADDVAGGEEILADDALAFVEELHHRFDARRRERLEARRERRDRIARGEERLGFLAETADVRSGDWSVPPPPPALVDRRVEITGPAAPAKMAINALNSGARVWLADLEDACSPTWANIVGSIRNLRDAARGTLAFTSPEGKEYALRDDIRRPTVVTRPRGWHLPEKHVLVDGERASASLVDFGLHAFHTAQLLIDRGDAPFYYLPKLESHLEARLWNDVFSFAEERMSLAPGTIRATVLIETIPAAFEMDEILYELRDHASGLNAGRWDYLFSIIKVFRDAGPEFVVPDRASVAMTAPFMRAYTELLVKTCHRRGAVAMGGMAAFVPNRADPEATAVAFEKVRADKAREADDGFDGSWVAHPDLVPVCREVFDGVLGDRPNQLDRQRPEVEVSAAELLDVAATGGQVTEAGLRTNLSVAVAYLAVWLSGNGAVALHSLMEDAATAEISRSQVWQQLRHETVLADSGRRLTPALVREVLDDEVAALRADVPPDRFTAHYEPAARLVADLCLADEYVDFLTLPAYELLE